ncbi:MAG: hypothetical protein FJZ58_06785 [Chlamydiae bacterium]|nr:hypothetical protein [Chlamydiota bacterium]
MSMRAEGPLNPWLQQVLKEEVRDSKKQIVDQVAREALKPLQEGDSVLGLPRISEQDAEKITPRQARLLSKKVDLALQEEAKTGKCSEEQRELLKAIETISPYAMEKFSKTALESFSARTLLHFPKPALDTLSKETLRGLSKKIHEEIPKKEGSLYEVDDTSSEWKYYNQLNHYRFFEHGQKKNYTPPQLPFGQ